MFSKQEFERKLTDSTIHLEELRILFQSFVILEISKKPSNLAVSFQCTLIASVVSHTRTDHRIFVQLSLLGLC